MVRDSARGDPQPRVDGDQHAKMAPPGRHRQEGPGDGAENEGEAVVPQQLALEQPLPGQLHHSPALDQHLPQAPAAAVPTRTQRQDQLADPPVELALDAGELDRDHPGVPPSHRHVTLL